MRTWAIQSSGVEATNTQLAMDACFELGAPYIDLGLIPFTDKIVGYDQLDMAVDYFFYGNTKLVELINKTFFRHGLFYDSRTFNVAAWNIYRDDMLNQDARITTVWNFLNTEGTFFVRPLHDLKSFAGQVVFDDESKSDWFNKTSYSGTMFNAGTYVAYSEPKNIAAEIRAFIVRGKVITASWYRTDGRLQYMPIYEHQKVMIELQKMADKWLPLDTVAMDVALVDGCAKVIEFNCINCSGFYASDVKKLIQTI